MTNILCYLFGHKATEPTSGVMVCDRCDSVDAPYLDGSEWTEAERDGAIRRLRSFCCHIKHLVLPRCLQCRKLIIWPHKKEAYGSRWWCSDKCAADYVPF